MLLLLITSALAAGWYAVQYRNSILEDSLRTFLEAKGWRVHSLELLSTSTTTAQFGHIELARAHDSDIRIEIEDGLTIRFLSEDLWGLVRGSLSGKVVSVDVESELVDAGIEIKNPRVKLLLIFNEARKPISATLEKAEAEVFEGTFKIQKGKLDFERSKYSFPIVFHALDLPEILKLYNSGALVATGMLDGYFVLNVTTNGASVADGTVEASESGGKIEYRGSTESPQNADVDIATPQGKAALAFSALRNFHYRNLTAKFQYAASGELKMAVNLNGANPELLEGRQINFSITLEENVLKLLKSLRIGRVFPKS